MLLKNDLQYRLPQDDEVDTTEIMPLPEEGRVHVVEWRRNRLSPSGRDIFNVTECEVGDPPDITIERMRRKDVTRVVCWLAQMIQFQKEGRFAMGEFIKIKSMYGGSKFMVWLYDNDKEIERHIVEA